MQDTAMDILSIIVKFSPVPLSTILVNTAFPALVRCILSTDDNSIMQSGNDLVNFIITSDLDLLIHFN